MASSSASHIIEEVVEVVEVNDGDIVKIEPASVEFLQPDFKKITTCNLEDLPVVEQIEKPRTLRKKQKAWKFPRTRASTAALKSLTTSDIELAGSSSRTKASTAALKSLTTSDMELAGSSSSNATQELEVMPVVKFLQVASADDSLNSQAVLFVPLEVDTSQMTFVISSAESTPINSEPNMPIKSKPNTPNQKSKKSQRKSRPMTADPLNVSTEDWTGPKKTCLRKLLPPPSSCPTADPSTKTTNLQSNPTAVSPSAGEAEASTSAGVASSSGRRSGYGEFTNAEIQTLMALTNNDSDDEEEQTNMDLEPMPHPRSRQLEFSSYDSDDEDEQPPIPASLNLDWEPSEPNVQEVADPANRFHFEWRSFSSTPLPNPETRRLQFDDSDCGPTIHPATPYDAFLQIWDKQIAELIVRETNEYARLAADCRSRGLPGYKPLSSKSRLKRWKDLDVDEFYRYLALVLNMGFVVKSRLGEYWDANTESAIYTPGFSRNMSINRFLLVNRYLHFNSLDPDQPLPQSVSRAFKLEPIITHLNSKFASLYRPARNLAIDESLVLWKGLLSMKQFIRNKAASEGVKFYDVCESDTGYLYRFEMHTGEHVGSSETPISGNVPSLVLKLLKGLEHKGHTVWMDNYYNSPALARELRYRGFDCVGTLRLNRKFVPVELKNLSINDLAPGEVRGCTSGDVDLLVWRGKRQVALISTYHGLATAMDKDELKPSIVPDYNLCMGGVDTKDQLLAMYPVERTRQRVWYKKMFRRLLNASVLNAYIIFKANNKISHRKFRRVLIDDLLLRHKKPTLPPRPLRPATLASASSMSSIILTPTTVTTPTPVTIPTLPCCCLGRSSKKGEKTRRVCKLCKKRVATFCKKCSIFVCEEPCFETHMIETFHRLYRVGHT